MPCLTLSILPSALLVTSRQSIPLPGVERVDLDKLAPPEAAKLLRKNLGEDRASDDEIARLAELCGYLPLALRAAGERLAGTPVTGQVRNLLSCVMQGSNRPAAFRRIALAAPTWHPDNRRLTPAPPPPA